MGRGIQVTVSCYAGCRADERPLRFSFGDGSGDRRDLEVEELIDRWYGPDYRYFKVRASDGCLYILRHDEARDEWEIEFFDGRQREG